MPYPNTNSPIRRPNQPSFNASLPPELKNELPGLYNNMQHGGSHTSTNYHSNMNQMPSTFAIASNNLLRRYI